MRVLHAPKNAAGQATQISRGQRKLGIISDVLVLNQNQFGYECDIDLKLNGLSTPAKYGRLTKNFIRSISKYDVFHFHCGESLLPLNLDLPILRLLGKKMVMHYWGSDIIQMDIAKNYTLIPEKVMKAVYPNLNDEKRRKRLRGINRWVDCSIVGDYSLLPYLPTSKVVRQAMDISTIPFVGCEPVRTVPNIVHAPSNRLIKGTGLILEALDKLKTDGVKFNLILVENKPHAEAMEIFKQADIVIDEVQQGPYGIFSMECMALGKPVLCRIDEKLKKYYTGLPIVDTPPQKVYQNVKELIDDPQRRVDLGRRGRMYMESNHDYVTVAKSISQIYESFDS